MTRQTPYEILGVSQDDDMKTVKRAWHALCLSSHPDKMGQTVEAHENFIRIQEAYQSICKTLNRRALLSEKTNSDQPVGNEKPWYEPSSEINYPTRGKYGIQFMSHRAATDEIRVIDFNLLLLSIRLDAFFIRYAIVCPHSEMPTWATLHRCSVSLEATYEAVKTLASRTSDIADQSWEQDDDQTFDILAAVSRLRARCERMTEAQDQLENAARVVEMTPVLSRQGPKRLLLAEAMKWP
ncbi:hypothetical protein EV127DRAFT_482195 [Xylaria flabelliformis]|nr:hypothetical protein EV127DRAFT_482195 [Xylaria flabelliformis]